MCINGFNYLVALLQDQLFETIKWVQLVLLYLTIYKIKCPFSAYYPFFMSIKSVLIKTMSRQPINLLAINTQMKI